MNILTQGLLITLIGMGLVFLSIVLLWGLMALMVWLGSKPADSSSEKPDGDVPDDQTETTAGSFNVKKRLAAAAAVAYALAGKTRDIQSGEKLSGLSGNAWQSTQRAQVLQGKANIFTSRSTRR